MNPADLTHDQAIDLARMMGAGSVDMQRTLIVHLLERVRILEALLGRGKKPAAPAPVRAFGQQFPHIPHPDPEPVAQAPAPVASAIPLPSWFDPGSLPVGVAPVPSPIAPEPEPSV
jgi:hypothetical protein